MQVKFRTQNPMNFAAYSYVIVFNTDGTSNAQASTPIANGISNNYQGYSIAIVVTQTGGGVTATPYYFQRPNGNASAVPILLQIPLTGQSLYLNANSNGLGTEFSVQFARIITTFYSATTPSPTASASASPTASPTGSASPTPTPAAGATWYFNFLTTQGNITNNQSLSTVLDSLGSGGATDTSYISQPLYVDTTFDTGSFYASLPANPPSDGAAEITGGDISNTQ